MTLTALEICMIAIQLALCMQLGTLCIQLSHLYSTLSCLKKPLSSWSHNMNAVFSPGFFEGIVGGGGGGGGQALWQGGGRNVRDYLAFVFIAAPLVTAPLVKR